jgi:hypothetical protein
MISVIKALMAGDRDMAADFVKAKEFWRDFFFVNKDASVKRMAEALSEVQFDFERLFNMNRGFAKEIMPYTALAYLYDEQNGFESESVARAVVHGFEQSMCSLEVKYSAKRAAALFHLS